MAASLIRAASGAFGLPALFSPTPEAGKRTLEFFTANIRNPNTRRAYARAAVEFSAWCEDVRAGAKPVQICRLETGAAEGSTALWD